MVTNTAVMTSVTLAEEPRTALLTETQEDRNREYSSSRKSPWKKNPSLPFKQVLEELYGFENMIIWQESEGQYQHLKPLW